MTVITRFAPSPTGYLHIGGARTALFNFLFSRHYGGKFLLRIEDTDRARSTEAAVQVILDGLKWLGLDWDEEPIFQFSRLTRHAEIAQEMVKRGSAYYCYASQEEIQAAREQARAENRSYHFQSPWRDKNAPREMDGQKAVIRLKAPREGKTVIEDLVQGKVTVPNEEIDDLVLLRSDGTPTYMLAVVVDDHDMNITHVIRGDDHLTNAFRQYHIYQAMGWEVPYFAHIPLIHGNDGAKLSKRHGAMPVGSYRDMGFLPEAVNNYLMRLGWSHGNDEIIAMQDAIKWFEIKDVNKAPSRFDVTKLTKLNAHYIKEADDERLLQLITHQQPDLQELEVIRRGLPGLKQRAATILELAENAFIYVHKPPFGPLPETVSLEDFEVLANIIPLYENHNIWEEKELLALTRIYAEERGHKLGEVARVLRLALCGKTTSPSVFEMMYSFGKEEALSRLRYLYKHHLIK